MSLLLYNDVRGVATEGFSREGEPLFLYAVRRGVMLVGRSSRVLDIALDRSMEQVPRCAR